ncbi:hypothetical protein FI667_g8177, partial [Globisporangium splendens]
MSATSMSVSASVDSAAAKISGTLSQDFVNAAPRDPVDEPTRLPYIISACISEKPKPPAANTHKGRRDVIERELARRRRDLAHRALGARVEHEEHVAEGLLDDDADRDRGLDRVLERRDDAPERRSDEDRDEPRERAAQRDDHELCALGDHHEEERGQWPEGRQDAAEEQRPVHLAVVQRHVLQVLSFNARFLCLFRAFSSKQTGCFWVVAIPVAYWQHNRYCVIFVSQHVERPTFVFEEASMRVSIELCSRSVAAVCACVEEKVHIENEDARLIAAGGSASCL